MRTGPLALLGTLLLAGTATTADAARRRCAIRVGELVPNERVAREVAEAVLRARQTPEQMASFVLRVEQDARRADRWVVRQSHPESRPNADGEIFVRSGGGMQMRIDKCTGRISDAHYQR